MPKVYRAEMGVPPMPDEGAPGLMSREKRMGNISIGSPDDLTPEERRKFSRMPSEPVSGKEVGVEKKASKVYEKTFAKGGSASSRADGIAKRGKTRGKIC